MSVEEYLAAEATAFERHEFLDGEVRAMPSASTAHVLLTSTLGEIIAPKLRKRGDCRTLDQDVQVWIPEFRTYTYPDRAIACPPEFAKKGAASLLNPKVIFEALSPPPRRTTGGASSAGTALFRRWRSTS